MKEEVKNKQDKKFVFNNKIKIIYIIGAIVLAFYIIIALAARPSDCRSIANKISKLFENSMIEDKGSDKDFKYSYTESYRIYTNEGNLSGDRNYAVMIFKYNSNKEAEQTKKYLNDSYQLFHKKSDGKIIETLDQTKELFEWEKDIIIVNGIYMIKINSYYKDRYSELEKEINKITKKHKTKDISKIDSDEMKKYWDEQLAIAEKQFNEFYNSSIEVFGEIINEQLTKIDTCKGYLCEHYLNEVLEYKKYEEVADKISLVQNKYDEVMTRKKELVNSINASISNVERSLNQDDYDKIKEEIDNLNDSYYDEYEEEWFNRLEKIKEKTFKNSCKSYSYKDVLRNPIDYYGTKAYWFGVITQKVSSYQYRVGVDCTKYQYIDGYSCKNTIYVNYYGTTNLIEDDVVRLWGKMNGTKTYTAVLGNSITIPEFTAEYVALQ